MQEPGAPLARRSPREDASHASDRLALGSALVGGLLVAAVLAARLAFSGGDRRANTALLSLSATSQPVQVQTSVVAQQPNSVSPDQGRLPPTPEMGQEVAHIANTDGQGVVLRASPRDDDRTPRGFLDGDAVAVLERHGADWARIRGDNGQEGWVPARYLGR